MEPALRRAILLHVFAPSTRDGARQAPTWEWFAKNESTLHFLNTLHVPADSETSYDSALRACWNFGAGDLLVIEHDIVPDDPSRLRELLDCPEPLCSYNYLLCSSTYTVVCELSIGTVAVVVREDPHSHLRQYIDSARASWRWYQYGEYADLSGLGLCKIGRKVIQQNPPAWAGPPVWFDLDTRLSRWLRQLGFRWHVHGPAVEHTQASNPTPPILVEGMDGARIPIVALGELGPADRIAAQARLYGGRSVENLRSSRQDLDDFYLPYDEDYFRSNYVGERLEGQRIGRALYDRLRLSRVLDVGCASENILSGIRMEADANRTSVYLRGIESPNAVPIIERLSRELPMPLLAGELIPLDLRTADESISERIGSAWDVLICTETAEHLPRESGPGLVSFLGGLGASYILWSAAIPGQGGRQHLNERPMEYWSGLFTAAGYGRDAEVTDWILDRLGKTSRAPWYKRLVVYKLSS